jgi:hypothetical protein
MSRLDVEIYTDQGNFAILRLPERRYPGVLVQGDTLATICRAVDAIRSRVHEFGDEDLLEQALELDRILKAALHKYEGVLRANDIDLPY